MVKKQNFLTILFLYKSRLTRSAGRISVFYKLINRSHRLNWNALVVAEYIEISVCWSGLLAGNTKSANVSASGVYTKGVEKFSFLVCKSLAILSEIS